MNPQNPLPPVPQPVITVSNQQATPNVQPTTPVAPAPQTPGVQPAPTTAPAMNYATIGQRFWAALLDGVILAIISSLVTLPFTLAATLASDGSSDGSTAFMGIQMLSNLLSMVVSIGYPLYFIGKKGATPGKMALKIKVVKKDNPAEEIGYMGAFLRESVGKLLSSILLLGYITAFKDPNKQTWHDKIANTVVIKA